VYDLVVEFPKMKVGVATVHRIKTAMADAA